MGGGDPGASTATFVCPCAISILEQCGGQEDILRFDFYFYFISILLSSLFSVFYVCFCLGMFVLFRLFVKKFKFIYLFIPYFRCKFDSSHISHPFKFFYHSLTFYIFIFFFPLSLFLFASIPLLLFPRVMPFLSCTDRETYLTLEYLRNSTSNSTFSDSSDYNMVRK
jgi:hypothetical protein